MSDTYDDHEPSHDLLSLAREIADYQFGPGCGLALFPDGTRLKTSRKGRLRYAEQDGKFICSFGKDSLINLSEESARRLTLCNTQKYFVVSGEAAEDVKKGRSLYAKHVIRSGAVYSGEEVIMLDTSGNLLGWGKALWSSSALKNLRRSALVKQRRRTWPTEKR
ncbi:MAG: PUA domain-containing protein [Thermoprotei archaeon]|nr:hypothetical protein [TACK group archaeon]